MRDISRTGPFLADVYANGSRGSSQVPIADNVKLKGKVNVFHPGRTIALPLYPQMTMADLELVVSALKKATDPK
jgi:hypothetical protein